MPEDPRVVRTQERVHAAVIRVLVTEGLAALTPQRVAEVSGVGRATVYRHWAGRDALLRDALAHARFPQAEHVGDLQADAFAVLDSLRQGLVEGPLRIVVATLLATSPHDPAARAVLDDLMEQGHRALHGVFLREGIGAERAERLVDRLGGVVFYRALLRGHDLTEADLRALVREELGG